MSDTRDKEMTARDIAIEAEVVIECFDGLDGGRASREETRVIIEKYLKLYAQQEAKLLVKALAKMSCTHPIYSIGAYCCESARALLTFNQRNSQEK